MYTLPMHFYQDPLEAEAVISQQDLKILLKFTKRRVLIRGVLWDIKSVLIKGEKAKIYLEKSVEYKRLARVK